MGSWDKQDESLQSRYSLLRFLQPRTRRDTLRRCSSFALYESGHVRLMGHLGGGRSSFAGLARCKQGSVCPVCAPGIEQQTRMDMAQVIAWATAQGLSATFTTWTVPHRRTDSLHKVATALDMGLEGQRHAMSGRGALARVMSELGYRGAITVIEDKWSPQHGWHRHAHELAFYECAPMTQDEADALLDMRFAAFDRRIARCTKKWTETYVRRGKELTRERGLRRPERKAQDTVPISDLKSLLSVGLYMGKGSGDALRAPDPSDPQTVSVTPEGQVLLREMTDSVSKGAKGRARARRKTRLDGQDGSLTLWEVLERWASKVAVLECSRAAGASEKRLSLLEEQAAQYAAVWYEYEAATKGRRRWRTCGEVRAIVKDARASFTIEQADAGVDAQVLLTLASWSQVSRGRHEAPLLAAARHGGLAGAVGYCTANRLAFAEGAFAEVIEGSQGHGVVPGRSVAPGDFLYGAISQGMSLSEGRAAMGVLFSRVESAWMQLRSAALSRGLILPESVSVAWHTGWVDSDFGGRAPARDGISEYFGIVGGDSVDAHLNMGLHDDVFSISGRYSDGQSLRTIEGVATADVEALRAAMLDLFELLRGPVTWWW